ncbi:hypothetical protein Dimus_007505 [Dionaea muscipula]
MGAAAAAEMVCPGEHCARWASEYMGYCLCGTKDAVSLALGMLSIVSWGVAEIPQIITNYRTKSTSGLSFAFLFTWIIGDLFNLFGCVLEPETLPTQYYIAVLYTATTLALGLQSIYYGHIYHRLKSTKQLHKGARSSPDQTIGKNRHDSFGEEKLMNGNDSQGYGSAMSQDGTTPSSPIPFPFLPRSCSTGSETYYMSARSLSTSHTSTRGSSLAQRWAASIDFDNSAEEPLLCGSYPSKTTPHSNTKSILCVVSVVTFFVGGLNTSRIESRQPGMVLEVPKQHILKQLKRKLLQVNDKPLTNSGGGGSGALGAYLGWAMAATYMGGRLPQICLNIRRGNVEGLNPLMFLFALVGNGTYVASILVNSLKWSKIRPNLPWLVDAGGCALLDTFILIQFAYFHHRASKCVIIKQGAPNSA